MSHAGMIIGLPGLQIERVKRSRGVAVLASIGDYRGLGDGVWRILRIGL